MKCILLLFCFVSLTGITFAQKQGQPLIDSLLSRLAQMKEDTDKVKLLGTVAKTYMITGAKEEFTYQHDALRLAQKIGWKKGIAVNLNNLGLMVGDTGNNSLARDLFEQSYALNQSLASGIDMVNNLNNIGRSYQRQSDFSKAIKYFYDALKIAEDIKSNEKIALVCTNITASFKAQHNYEKAAEYAEKGLKNAELAHSDNNIGKSLLQLGVIKMETKDSIGARVYMERALKVYQGLGNKMQVAIVLTNMADLSFPDHNKQLSIMLKAQQIFDSIAPASIGAISNLANMGQACFELAEHSKLPERNLFLQRSEAYLTRGEALCRQTSNAEILSSIDLTRSKLEETKGNYKASLDYYKRYSSINDSLFSQENKNDIAGLEERHTVALKDDEIALNQLRLSNQQHIGIGLIAGLLLAALIGLILYRQVLTRKRTNTTLMVLNHQLDEANKVKTRFFGILSHDLRSPVSNLIHFLHLQKNDPGILSKADEARHRQLISQSAEDLLTNMESMLLWSKEQMENFRPSIAHVAVSDLFDYLKRFFARTEDIVIRFNDATDIIIMTDENYLRIIMQNLTSNAIKALKDTRDAKISWEVQREGEKTLLSITDNGPGISDEDTNTLYEDNAGMNTRGGFGFHLIRDLAKAIRYNISVRSNPGKGTTFTLWIGG